MPKLLRQNVGGIDYNVAGCALTASCSTAAATAAKVAVLSDGDTLADGMSVAVQFTEGNTAASPLTLTVGGVTANICDSRGLNIGGTIWQAGDVITFLYTHGKFCLLSCVADIIHYDITVVAESGVSFNNMYEALSYQLSHADWSSLLSKPNFVTTGRFELQGQYYGQYIAHHVGNGYICVEGSIDWLIRPSTFSALYDSNVGWKYSIDGQEFVYCANNILITRDIATQRRYTVQSLGTTDLSYLYNALESNGLLSITSQGWLIWTPGTTHTYQAGSSYDGYHFSDTLPTTKQWFSNFKLNAIDGVNQAWWVYWHDGVRDYACNLWGETNPVVEYVRMDIVL